MINKNSDSNKLLQVYNLHSEKCGFPPVIDVKCRYVSYFENVYGEQWVFLGDKKLDKATIYCGEGGWGNPIELSADKLCPNIPLNDLEKNWIVLSWAAMTDMNYLEVEELYQKHATELADKLIFKHSKEKP